MWYNFVLFNLKVTWLANWTDNVNGDSKYVFLNAASRFKVLVNLFPQVLSYLT